MSQNSKLLQVFEGTENSNKGPVFLTMSKKKNPKQTDLPPLFLSISNGC